jgi:hypothetical protein
MMGNARELGTLPYGWRQVRVVGRGGGRAELGRPTCPARSWCSCTSSERERSSPLEASIGSVRTSGMSSASTKKLVKARAARAAMTMAYAHGLAIGMGRGERIAGRGFGGRGHGRDVETRADAVAGQRQRPMVVAGQRPCSNPLCRARAQGNAKEGSGTVIRH